MSESTPGSTKGQMIKMIGAVTGAMAVLVGAVTPLYLGVLDRTGKAEKEAKESKDKAEKSKGMSELGYKLLRRDVEDIKEELERIRDYQADMRRIFVESLSSRSGNQEPRWGVEVPSRSRSVRRARGAENSEPIKDELEPPPQSPAIQRRLPADLEKEFMAK